MKQNIKILVKKINTHSSKIKGILVFKANFINISVIFNVFIEGITLNFHEEHFFIERFPFIGYFGSSSFILSFSKPLLIPFLGYSRVSMRPLK